MDRSRYAKTLREFGLGGEDLAAWRESTLPDEAFEDWLTDRVARRPSGLRARQVYGAEDVQTLRVARFSTCWCSGRTTTCLRSDAEGASSSVTRSRPAPA